MIAVNNSLSARKCYSSREYFRPLGCIKRCKWIFRKVLVVHCFRCQIAKKLILYCQKLLVARKSTLPGTSWKDVLLPPLSAVCSQEMFSIPISSFHPSNVYQSTFFNIHTVVTILSFKNLAKKSKHQNKHCQRHNGPKGWVLLTKVTSLGHITISYTNLDQTYSESQPSTNFKVSTKYQHFDKT